VNTPVIVTIDPGIDVTGVAIWKPELVRAGEFFGVARALVAIKSIRSRVSDNSAERCKSLARQLAFVLTSARPQTVYIEQPPDWHGARERRGMQQTATMKAAIAKVNRAFGACAAAAAAGDIEVVAVPASRLHKEYRYEQAVKACAKIEGGPQPQNDDERSAVWIGLELISTGAWRGQRAAAIG
jgi:Holliday junction resolvasome RuvABC endonuclease subunit